MLRESVCAIIAPMTQSSLPKSGLPKDEFPYSTIIARWFFIAAEMGLATYFVFLFGKFNLGYIFIIYGIVSLTVVLPLIRCVRCYYYGKRCNVGWGKIVPLFYRRSEDDSFSSRYGYSFLLWPLRLIPFGVGFLKILAGFMDEFTFVPQGLFAVYLIVLYLHRKFYRSVSCSKCHQRSVCPVYNIAVMKDNLNSNRYNG